MMRLINGCHEAPNLQLMYWPELDVAKRVLPRRAYLVAKHDIPPSVELTWDYGKLYPRPWLAAPAPSLAPGDEPLDGANAPPNVDTLPSNVTEPSMRFAIVPAQFDDDDKPLAITVSGAPPSATTCIGQTDETDTDRRYVNAALLGANCCPFADTLTK